jgi:hypothetical protein
MALVTKIDSVADKRLRAVQAQVVTRYLWYQALIRRFQTKVSENRLRIWLDLAVHLVSFAVATESSNDSAQ